MFEVTLTFDNGPEPPAMPVVLDVREHTISNPIDCKLWHILREDGWRIKMNDQHLTRSLRFIA
jgi:hypothetical protein